MSVTGHFDYMRKKYFNPRNFCNNHVTEGRNYATLKYSKQNKIVDLTTFFHSIAACVALHMEHHHARYEVVKQ